MATFTGSAADIAIICSDFDASFRFYHELLGLEVHQDVRIPGDVAGELGLAPRGFRQVRLRAGDTLIKLVEIDDPPGPLPEAFAAGVRWITFRVDDIRALYRDGKLRGVPFLSEVPDSMNIVCARDPNGVIVEFIQS